MIGLGTQATVQQAQGRPYLSDGTTSLSATPNGGIYEIKACGRAYYITNQHGMDTFNKMRSNL